MKKLSIAFAFVIAATTLAAPAIAAEKPTSVAGCKKATAKGHTPAKVVQPKRQLQSFQQHLLLLPTVVTS